MWRNPLPLTAGEQADIVQTITVDTYIGDLWDFVGNPTGPVAVEITVDACDVGEIIIPTDFGVGSTFEFIGVNGGRFLGEGGYGGRGGESYGSTGEPGSQGQNGTPAIKNSGNYPVSLNVDDGFIFGGGGGGGGGSYTRVTATIGQNGGGGGGGQGWSGGAGGDAGTPTEFPPAIDGTAGTRNSAGIGGLASFTVETSDGGDGGEWGLGGHTGRSSDLIGGVGFSASFFYYGGQGGDAGEAYFGANLTFSGVETEATLRSQGRILGETSASRLSVPNFQSYWSGKIGIPYDSNCGIGFRSDGKYIEIDTNSTPTASTTYYTSGSGASGSDYEVRIRGLSGDTSQSYTTTPAANGTWVSIGTLKQWYRAFTGTGHVAALFELRRSDIPGATSTSDEVMMSFYVKNIFEAEP